MRHPSAAKMSTPAKQGLSRTRSVQIKKGLRQKNEVGVRVTATGADIQINGTELANIVARPSADAQYYGALFRPPKTEQAYVRENRRASSNERQSWIVSSSRTKHQSDRCPPVEARS